MTLWSDANENTIHFPHQALDAVRNALGSLRRLKQYLFVAGDRLNPAGFRTRPIIGVLCCEAAGDQGLDGAGQPADLGEGQDPLFT